MLSDVGAGAWLSPGLDSSGVTAVMASLMDEPVDAFSLGFLNFQEADELEQNATLDQYPNQNVRGHRLQCGADHFELMPKALWHHEEPSTALTFLTRMILAQATAQKHKVALTGEGGDEIFGGCPWYLGDRLASLFRVIPHQLRSRMADGLGLPRWRPGLARLLLASNSSDLTHYAQIVDPFPFGNRNELFRAELRESLAGVGSEQMDLAKPSGFQEWPPFARMQYVEAKTRMAGYVILNLDRMTMAYSLEARVPFLDHEFVELCGQIPISLRLKGMQEKYILRRALAKWLPRKYASAVSGAW